MQGLGGMFGTARMSMSTTSVCQILHLLRPTNAYQQSAIHGFFAKVYNKLLECHRLIVDGDDEMT
jgi:hypothetical protein